jgi:hypothetical protein
MEGADTRTGEAMKFLEPLKFELYGEATGSFMAAMGDTVSLLQIEPNHMAGFDRF